MNVTKALTCLGLVTGRGMDNGQQVQRFLHRGWFQRMLTKGALLLSNQVSVVVHDLEQKRVDCLKTQEKIRKEKEKKSKAFKVVV